MAKDNILFDIIKALFCDKDYIENLPKQSIISNYFMINRRLAINYPLQAQVFNNNKINEVDVIKFWADFLNNGKAYAPKWIYTPGANKSQDKAQSKKKVTNAQIEKFAKYYNINKKDINTALDFFNEEMTAEILDFDKFINSVNNN